MYKKRNLLIVCYFVGLLTTLAQVTPYSFSGTVGPYTKTLTPLSNTDKDISSKLQSLIDQAALQPGGGTIAISAGTYRLKNVAVKSNIFIAIDKNAIIKPFFAKGNKSKGVTCFYIGEEGEVLDVQENIKVFCSNCNGEEKYTIDVDGGEHFNAFRVVEAKDFQISDFLVLDNFSRISALTFGPSFTGYRKMPKETNTGEPVLNDDGTPRMIEVPLGVSWTPLNGLVKNSEIRKAHYGYGLVQAQVGRNITFRDLKGEGGATLRLESGAAISMLPASKDMELGRFHKIYAENITSINGKVGLMLSPHGRIHGSVEARNIISDGSGFAVKVESGFLDRDIGKTLLDEEPDYGKGYFQNVIINGITATYREGTAQLKSKDYDFSPNAIRQANPFKSLPVAKFSKEIRLYNSVAPFCYAAVDSPEQAQDFNNGVLVKTHDRNHADAGKYNVHVSSDIVGHGWDNSPQSTCIATLYADKGYPFTVFDQNKRNLDCSGSEVVTSKKGKSKRNKNKMKNRLNKKKGKKKKE